MQKVQTFHLDVDDITMFIVHALNKQFGTCLIVVTTKLLVVVINLHARPPPGAPNHVVTDNLLATIRLLKGAPPGQEAVNHYISELSIEKKNNSKLASKERKHLTMLEACDDEYQYHYKLFGEGAGADRDMKFYAPQMVKDYINQIRRF